MILDPREQPMMNLTLLRLSFLPPAIQFSWAMITWNIHGVPGTRYEHIGGVGVITDYLLPTTSISMPGLELLGVCKASRKAAQKKPPSLLPTTLHEKVLASS